MFHLNNNDSNSSSNSQNAIPDLEYINGISNIRNEESIELLSYNSIENGTSLIRKVFNNKNV